MRGMPDDAAALKSLPARTPRGRIEWLDFNIRAFPGRRGAVREARAARRTGIRMTSPRYGQLGLMALLAVPAAAHADKLPALRIDPGLLGAAPVRVPAGVAPVAATPSVGAASVGAAAPAAASPANVSAKPALAPVAKPITPARASAIPVPALGDETVIDARRFEALDDRRVVAIGDVELTKRDARLLTDRLVYDKAGDDIEAVGNVHLSRGGEQMHGPRLKLSLANDTGVFEKPSYQIQRSLIREAPQPTPADSGARLPTGSGSAAALHFEGKGQYRLEDATYSTCPANPDGSFDWFARIGDLALDYVDETGTGRHGAVYFKDVPILYSPWLTFPLNNRRKSGLLTPSIGSSSNTGFEYTQPIYWNIAPNYDATLYPRLMTKRGIQLGAEFRYLGAAQKGQIEAEYIPNDNELGDSRSRLYWKHAQDLGYGFGSFVDFHGVSDSTYFRDLSTRLSSVSQTNLLRQAGIASAGAWWRGTLAAIDYQTLQDPNLPVIAEPYQRLPQLRLEAFRYDLPFGLEARALAEYVDFRHPDRAEGRRTSLYPQLALPLHGAAWYVTPKAGVRSLRYDIDRYRAFDATGPDRLSTSVNVPIASVDSGLFFERDFSWLESTLTQTLEPRLYYLYAPARRQSQIPAFDTAIADFNFAQIFSESRYVGGDRIADANQLTAMVSSRFIDPTTGAERLRAGFGQRFYFDDQQVGLPGETLRTDRKTDLLAAISGQLTSQWFVDAAWQYNPREAQTERLNLGARFQPGPGRVINAGYRYAREAVGAPLSGFGQVDVSAQWPLGGGWYGVGRYNYSTKDSRVIEALGGAEYDGGCWVARAVIQRTATLVRESNTAFFFQLELNDFSRIGSNPLDLLKRSVPGYGAVSAGGMIEDADDPSASFLRTTP